MTTYETNYVTVMVSKYIALKGWQWGSSDGVARWGENTVDSAAGNLLRASFSAGAGPNEAHLSTGDSGGAVFINDGTSWKLAGINYAVEGPFNTGTNGPGFLAAITDKGGLFSFVNGNWITNADTFVDMPSALYMTRVAAHQAWIQSVIHGPIPSVPPRLESAPAVTGTYQEESGATLDAGARTFTLPKPVQNRFFRLNGCEPSHIAEISVSGTNLVIRYD